MYGRSQSDEACLFLFPDCCSKAMPYAAPHGRTERRSSDLPRQRHSFARTLHSLLTRSRNFLFDDPSSEICSYSMCSGLRASQPKTGMGTCCRHMTVKMLTLEGQERDETRNMAKQTGVHDVILGWSPFIAVPFNPTGKRAWYKINLSTREGVMVQNQFQSPTALEIKSEL